MGNIDKIGTSIRSLRKANKMTLHELADRAELSSGYLSNIERNLSSPTLSILQRICEVFDTSFGDLIERTVQDRVVIRSMERDKYIKDEQDIQIDDVDFGINNANFLFVEIKPSAETKKEMWTHTYHEVGTVVKGQLTIVFEDEEIDLFEGDTIHVRPHTRHSFYNKSDEETSVSFWAKINEVEEQDT